MNILILLKPNIDKKYKAFQEKICHTKYEILGVKIPILRKIAKNLLKEYSVADIIDNLDFPYYECIMLEGLIIANANVSYEEKLQLITLFLPKIDNWAICDIFCSELKMVKHYKKEFLKFISNLLNSSEEYYVRVGIVILLNYYIDDKNIDYVLNKLLIIKNDKYYVKMAISWAYSICFIKYFDKTRDFFIKNQNKMNKWIYNKAIQKACESLQMKENNKKIIQKMKLN